MSRSTPHLADASGATVVSTIVDRVAEQRDVDPVELAPPLYSVVDPDALNTLVSTGGHARTEGRVEFTYCGCHVSVRFDGQVTVTAADSADGIGD